MTTEPAKKPASIAGAVAAASLCAGLVTMVSFGTLTMFIAAVLAFMLSRRAPETTYARAIVAGLVVGLFGGAFDGVSSALWDLLRSNAYGAGGYNDLYGGGSRLDEFLPQPGTPARIAIGCCGISITHPLFGVAGAWFGRAIGPAAPAAPAPPAQPVPKDEGSAPDSRSQP